MKHFILTLPVIMLMSCQASGESKDSHSDENRTYEINITVTNRSSKDLDWARWKIGDRTISAGVLSIGNFSTSIGVRLQAQVESSIVSFRDPQTKKRYEFKVSMTDAYNQIGAKRVRTLKLEIKSLDQSGMVIATE